MRVGVTIASGIISGGAILLACANVPGSAAPVSVIGGSALSSPQSGPFAFAGAVLRIAARADDRLGLPPAGDRAGRGGHDVMPPVLTRVQISPAGAVVFEGLATPGAEVLVERDGQTQGTARAGAGGDWRIAPDGRLEAGEHVFETRSFDEVSSTVAGADVRIAMPRDFAGAPIVAFERSSDEIERERDSITAATRRRAEELARAASDRFSAFEREAEQKRQRVSQAPSGDASRPGSGAPAAPPAEEGFGLDSVWLRVQEWLEHANREYQRRIVRKLQVPAPKEDTAEAPPDSERDAARAAADRQEQERRRAAEAEARRQAAEKQAAAERARIAADEERRRAAEAEARRQAAEKQAAAERARIAEQERLRDIEAEAEAERQRIAAAEKERAEAERVAEAERRRTAEIERQRRAAEEQAEAERRRTAEAEAQRRRALDGAAVARDRAAAEKARTGAERRQISKEPTARDAAVATQPRGAPSAGRPLTGADGSDVEAEPSDRRADNAFGRRTTRPDPAGRDGQEPTGGTRVTDAVRRDRQVDEARSAVTSGRRAGARAPAVAGYRSRRCLSHAGRTIRVPGTYTVARGDTLWAIAQRHYRRGYLYPLIVRANRHRISDPDLIYPCQRFHLPLRRRR